VSTIGILASGRGSNAEALLSAAASGRLPARIGVVLSDRVGAPVLGIAGRYGVPARYLDPGRPGGRLTPGAEGAFASALRDAGTDWVALAGFMRILGKPFLEAFPGRVLNIHPSLLPSFPGLHAQRQAIEYGVKVAGCTVHFVDDGVDSGPVVAQRPVPVLDHDTEETLSARILEAEHELYTEAFRLVLSGAYRVSGRRVLSILQRTS